MAGLTPPQELNLELYENNGVRLYYRPDTPDKIALDFNVKSQQQIKGISLEPTQRWLDLGAHIGAFTCYTALKVEHVTAVEGFKENYHLLRKNIQLNDLKNVTPLHGAVVAVPEPSGKVIFYESVKGKTLSGGTLPKRGRNPVAVPAFDCQQLLDSRDITHVKMSIEGAEGPVVLATNWKEVEYLEVEYNFWPAGDYSHSQYERMLDHLETQFQRVEGSRAKNNVWHRRVFCYGKV